MLRRTFLKTVPALGLLTACSKSARMKLALNWKPEPEFGGFYAAPYSKHGLAVDILPVARGLRRCRWSAPARWILELFPPMK